MVSFLVGCAATAVRDELSHPDAKQPTVSSVLPALIPSSVPAPVPAWGDTVDFDGLREAYGRREDFGDRCERNRPSDDVATALIDKDFGKVVSIATSWLERCPIDAQLHLYLAAALAERGRKVESDQHKKWFLGLTDSVLSSGDGKAPETAYRTISVPEEYAVLIRLRLQPESQALLDGPYQVDALTVVDEQGNRHTKYFNPAWHFIRLYHQVTDSPSG